MEIALLFLNNLNCKNKKNDYYLKKRRKKSPELDIWCSNF